MNQLFQYISFDAACVIALLAVNALLLMHYINKRASKKLIDTQHQLRQANHRLYEEIAKHELTESRYRYRNTLFEAIFDTIQAAIICVDCSGKILYANNPACKILNIAQDVSPFGRHLMELLRLEKVTPMQIEESFLHSAGITIEDAGAIDCFNWRHASLQSIPLNNAYFNGAIIKISDRTLEFATMKRELFDQKMSSMGDVAAGIAHEINNPLMGISSSASLLERKFRLQNPRDITAIEELGITTESVRKVFSLLKLDSYTGNIREASSIAGSIVTNMLNFARQGTVDLSLVNIDSMIHNTITAIQDAQPAAPHIQIINQTPPSAQLECSGLEIRQVLYNIIDNAIDAVRSVEEPLITLKVSAEEHTIRFDIINNGATIDNEKINHIFSPFYTTKEVGEGTGMGLSVCYFVVKNRHSGEIYAYTNDAEQTCFTVKLPKRQNIQAPLTSAERVHEIS